MIARTITVALLAAGASALRSRVPADQWTLTPLRKALQSQIKELAGQIDWKQVEAAKEKEKKATLAKRAAQIEDGYDHIKKLNDELANAEEADADAIDAVKKKLEKVEGDVKTWEFALNFLNASGVDMLASVENPNRNMVTVSWALLEAEEGTEVFPVIADGCEHNYQRLGQCVISKENGQATPGVIYNTTVPLDAKARITANGYGSFLGKNYEMSADCALCGEPCGFQLPLGGSVSIEMPECPLPLSFGYSSPSLDLSDIPEQVHGKFKLSTEIRRGGSTDVVSTLITEFEL